MNTYRTCVIKQYEKGLGVGTWGQDKKLIQIHFEENGLSPTFYEELLIQEINELKPRLIITLGEYALRVVTGQISIANFRGSILPISDKLQLKLNESVRRTMCLATLHPAIEHTDESQHYLLRMDFQKAIEVVYQQHKINDHEVVICHTFSEYTGFRSGYRNPVEMSEDVETHYGFNTCTSFTFDGRRAAVIPLVGSKVPIEDRARMEVMLARDLCDPEIEKNNQNIGYDKRIQQRFGYRVYPITWDTMLAASVIAPEFPKRLGFLTSIYTFMSYYKDEGKFFDPSKHSYDQLYEYCGKDSISAHQIKQGQIKDLTEMESLEFFRQFMMPKFMLYYTLDSTGILQDVAKRDELIIKYESLRDLKELELFAITQPQRLNLNSPTQIGKYMELVGMPVSRHRADSGFMVVNTDVASIKKMRSQTPSEYRHCTIPYEQCIRFLNLILLIRRIDKVLEYINVGVHPWGRIYTSSKLGGTASGRTAGGQTSDGIPQWVSTEGESKLLREKLGPVGLEFQQLGSSRQTVTKHGFLIEGDDDDDIDEGIIGKDVREMYIPDPGWVIIEIDRAQAEARVVDVLAEDWEGLEKYGKIDKHCEVAALIFPNYSYAEILYMAKKETDEEKHNNGEYMRQLGKKSRHATNYDMGPYRFSELANITQPFAKTILQTLGAAYPQIKEVFHKQVEDMVRRTRQMWNPYGRPRLFTKKLDNHGIKVAYSWFPQSTISDGTKEAMDRSADELDSLKYGFIAENHDSITGLVKRTYIRTYCRIIRQKLELPIDFRKGCFPRDYQLVIPTDISIGRHNWGDMHGIKRIKV